MKVVIVRYKAGNTASVSIALNRLGIEPVISADRNDLLSADKVIFPGVGEASAAMKYITERRLDDAIRSLRKPFLGICLGMQLMFEFSEENSTDCLGIVNGNVIRFDETKAKVPHTGWNRVSGLRTSLFDGINDGTYFYFVHGYYVDVAADTIAWAEHGTVFSAAIRQNNFYAVQFHPERSGPAGRLVLENFLKL